jgi:AAA domain
VFRGAKIVLMPDNDDTGRKKADAIGELLVGTVKRIRELELPGLDEGGDIIDWLAKEGNDWDKFAPLLGKAPLWESRGEPRVVITLAEFLRKFEPPDYLIEGLLQRHYLFYLTAMTGGGKTAIATLIAVLVAMRKHGLKFGPYPVKHGRWPHTACPDTADGDGWSTAHRHQAMLGLAAQPVRILFC